TFRFQRRPKQLGYRPRRGAGDRSRSRRDDRGPEHARERDQLPGTPALPAGACERRGGRVKGSCLRCRMILAGVGIAAGGVAGVGIAAALSAVPAPLTTGTPALKGTPERASLREAGISPPDVGILPPDVRTSSAHAGVWSADAGI